MLVSLVVTSGLFALLFRFLPDVRLRWKDVTTGAVVTAVLFTIGQQLIGLYLGQSSIASTYGAAGSMMILLLWVYYSCQILLYGAEFTRVWAARHGARPKPESFAVRLAWALGYFAEVTHYVAGGTIEGATGLSRARNCVAEDGTFSDARFELEDRSVRMLFDEHSWSWDDNPFVGTPQLNGLKMVNMLLSNWDTKDRRDVSRGSNTAIFEHRVARWGREARYLITDWGGAMGKWGSNVVSRGRWDVEGFEAQTQTFVTDVRDRYVCFAYQGQRTNEIARGITMEDAAWFYDIARRLSEDALRQGLLACGATEEEAGRFARALHNRIRQIGEACTIKAG